MGLPGISLILKVVSFVISSWILVHLLAIFGLFLAVAYPFWWLLVPKRTICFYCRARNDGDWCPFCHSKVKKVEGNSPKSFSSAVFNGLLILLFAPFSFGLVYMESKILFKMGFPPTPKTVSFIIPSKGQYRLGEIFPMKIEIAGVKTPINAVQADLSFDSQKLEVVDVSTEDSFAKIFIQKEINNEIGYTRLTGGLPNPGLFSEKGVFGTVFFQGKSPGIVKIDFLPSSMVLANDGRGTNVLKELASASYLILPEEVPEEERKQSEVLIRPVVLGERIEGTQIKFYEEEKVLGTQVSQEIEEGRRFNLGKSLFLLLERFDRFVLSFWARLKS